MSLVTSGGVAVTMIADIDEDKAKELGVTGVKQMTHVNSQKLTELTQLVEAGTVTPNVGQVFELADVQQAFEARESGTVHGKIVISL